MRAAPTLTLALLITLAVAAQRPPTSDSRPRQDPTARPVVESSGGRPSDLGASGGTLRCRFEVGDRGPSNIPNDIAEQPIIRDDPRTHIWRTLLSPDPGAVRPDRRLSDAEIFAAGDAGCLAALNDDLALWRVEWTPADEVPSNLPNDIVKPAPALSGAVVDNWIQCRQTPDERATDHRLSEAESFAVDEAGCLRALNDDLPLWRIQRSPDWPRGLERWDVVRLTRPRKSPPGKPRRARIVCSVHVVDEAGHAIPRASLYPFVPPETLYVRVRHPDPSPGSSTDDQGHGVVRGFGGTTNATVLGVVAEGFRYREIPIDGSQLHVVLKRAVPVRFESSRPLEIPAVLRGRAVAANLETSPASRATHLPFDEFPLPTGRSASAPRPMVVTSMTPGEYRVRLALGLRNITELRRDHVYRWETIELLAQLTVPDSTEELVVDVTVDEVALRKALDTL